MIFLLAAFLIKAVELDGVSSFPHEFLLERMKTRPGTEYNDYVWRRDIQKLLEFYKEKGYFDVKYIGTRMTLNFKEKNITLKLTIDEGERYRISRIVFKGGEVVPREKVLDALRIKEGGFYDDLMKTLSLYAIMDVYAREGYIRADVEDTIIINREEKSVEVVYTIDEGKRFYVGRVEMHGMEGIREGFRKRLVPVKRGEVYTPYLVENLKGNLYRSRLFREVRVNEEIREDTVDLVVDVVQDKKRSIRFGGGYLSPNWAVLKIYFTWRNIFGGGEDGKIEWKLKASLSDILQELEWKFTVPHLFDTPLTFLLKGNKDKEAEIRLGYNPGGGSGGYIAGGKDFENNILKVFSSLYLDRKNDPFDPSSGYFLNFSLARGISPYFTRAEGKAGVVFSFSRFVFEVMGHAGRVWSDVILPGKECFTLGGTNSLRGYDEGELGPYYDTLNLVHYGTELVSASAMLRVRILKKLHLEFFLDAGSLTSEGMDFHTGAGCGIYFVTPVGPIRVEYGKRLRDFEKDIGKFHFAIGRLF